MESLINQLVEPAIYAAIGFLAAVLLSLPLFGVVHRRAERLTRQRLDMLLPMSVKEMEAEKDLLRVEHAVAEQRLETALDDLRATKTAQQIEIGRHGGTLGQLKSELDARAQAIAALEAREAALARQLRALEQQHALQTVHLEGARATLRHKEAELARLAADLATQRTIAEQQNVALASARAAAVELAVGAEDGERERIALTARLARSHQEADAAGRQLAAFRLAAEQSQHERDASSTRLARSGEQTDAAGRQLADERGRQKELTELTRQLAQTSAQLAEARAALREQHAEIVRFAADFATGAAIIEQQDLELARARADLEALRLAAEQDQRERDAINARLARSGDETDAAGRQLADERGRAEDLGRRIADLEAELIAQQEAANSLAQLTAARICEQARRLAEHAHETERLHAALDAAQRAEAGLRYELTRVEERRMLESRAALAEKAALEIQLARLQLDREQRQMEAASGGHANGATNRHGAPADPHVVRLDPIVIRERRTRDEAAPHPGAN